tara:strand:+ start:100 stop:270 length:171 start_codon:yes stop_codon:yes gene_type:complete
MVLPIVDVTKFNSKVPHHYGRAHGEKKKNNKDFKESIHRILIDKNKVLGNDDELRS